MLGSINGVLQLQFQALPIAIKCYVRLLNLYFLIQWRIRLVKVDGILASLGKDIKTILGIVDKSNVGAGAIACAFVPNISRFSRR